MSLHLPRTAGLARATLAGEPPSAPHNGERFVRYLKGVYPGALIGLWLQNERAGLISHNQGYRRFDTGEMVANGGFETAGGGGADVFASWSEWTGDGAIARTTTAGEFAVGAAAAKITNGESVGTAISQAIPVVAGQSYTLEFQTRGDGVNAGRYQIANVGAWTSTDVSDTAYAAKQVGFTVPDGVTSITLWMAPATVNGAWCCFDAVSIKGTGQPAPGLYTGVTLGKPGPIPGLQAAGFDGATSYNDLWSAALANAFNTAEGTWAAWFKVNNAAQWDAGSGERLVGVIRVDANNGLFIEKTNNANQLYMGYRAGAAQKDLTRADTRETGWIFAAITYSVSRDQVRGFYQGLQFAATQTGLGTWAGSVPSNSAVIGALSTTPTVVWNGTIGPVMLFSQALPPRAIKEMYDTWRRMT